MATGPTFKDTYGAQKLKWKPHDSVFMKAAAKFGITIVRRYYRSRD